MDRSANGANERTLSLVIPAYNEEAGIVQAISEADQALRDLVADYEIIVVDDGSSDTTASLVTELVASNAHVRLIQQAGNRGYGAALRAGFEAARFDRVAFTDADCQFDLRDLGQLLEATDIAPIAVGRRVDRQDVWRRRFYSRGYNVLVRALLGTRVRDCDCALKVFRRSAIKQLLPDSTGFLANAEILTKARQRRMQVVEIGVRHRPRIHGESKVSVTDIPRTLMALFPFWWSMVLFPSAGAEAIASGVTGTGNGRRSRAAAPMFGGGALLIASIAAVLLFSRLNGALLEPDEARYAEIPRQMLMQDNFAVPVLHGQPYHHKPPMLYWLVMGSYQLFGIHDWAARLIPCLATFLLVMVTYLWGCRVTSVPAALFGALILCLSGRFLYLGRMLTMDGLLALAVVSAWACGHLALTNDKNRRLRIGWWLLSALACALGVLTKGPVALALVVAPIFLFQLLDQRVAWARLIHWAVFLGVVLAVSGPWFVWMGVRDPAFIREFFWVHNLVRFAAPIDHHEPFWYFIPSVLLGMLPWTLLLPVLIRWLSRRHGRHARCRPAALGFFLMTAGWCLTFYSAAGCKRPGYILPCMPMLALALGCTVHLALPSATALASKLCRLAFAATMVVLVSALGISITAAVVKLVSIELGCIMAATALIALAAQSRINAFGSPRTGWLVCGAATFASLFAGLNLILPGYEQKFSLREQVLPRDLATERTDVPVVCYPKRWDSVSFYLRKDDVRVFRADERKELVADLKSRPESIVFIKSDTPGVKPLQDFLRALPPSLEFIAQSRHGIVTTGTVKRRQEAPAMLLARQ